jgi:hypothetical protein
MYYRRKILLSLLQVFDNRLDKISLQKLLFLLTRQQQNKSYQFVPYKLGRFSFQASSDLQTLTKYNLVASSMNCWQKMDDKDYFAELKPKDKTAVRYVKNQYGHLSKDDLIRLTYRQFPYFAIHSTIANNYLTKEELEKVERQKPVKRTTTLFTIGYEGISLEQYLNKLILNDVKVLCDVRKNPVSMKFGFNKRQLMTACEDVGIQYIHIPEVGIESDKRQALSTQADYGKLFEFYKRGILKKTVQEQKEILSLLTTKKRIALTCFEANIHQCHRKYLAESISGLNEFSFKIKHL